MGNQSKRPHEEQIRQIAREKFGYESLRAGQEAAIKALLSSRDTLAVMPTGSGKSAIYQIAGILIPGSTVVISPLIALQRDQVESIAQQDVGEAAVVNSTVPTAERQEVFEALEEEELEFLFLAPEQFNNPDDDLKIRRFLASSGQVDAEEVEQVAAVVQEQDEPIKRRDLREQTGLSQAKVATALSRLEEVGVVEMLPTGEVVESEQPPEVSEAAQEAVRAQEHYQQYLRSASLVP